MGWRVFFWAAALFNFAAGLPLLLAPDVMLSSLNMPVPADLLYHRMTGLLVANFGLLYGFVATDPTRYRHTVWLGVLGKSGVILLIAQAWLQGAMPFSAFSVSLGDLVFTLGFVVFLMTYKPAK